MNGHETHRCLLLWRLTVIVAISIVTFPLQVASARPIAFGALYRPEHNWQYPVAGGLPDRGTLRAAITLDLQVLSKYLTHIRTLAATHFGIDVVPIAHEFGLKVFLGIPLYTTRSDYWQQIEALKRAVKRYPDTIEAVFLEDPVVNLNDSMILKRLKEVKYALGEHAASVKFGIPLWVDRPDKVGIADAFDVVGIDGAYDLSNVPAQGDIAFIQSGRCFSADPYMVRCTGQEANDHYDAFLQWKPPSLGIVKMWPAAFDRQDDDLNPGAQSDPFGLFTVDRERKDAGFPLPLSADDDPILLPSRPFDPNCPRGAYQQLFSFGQIREMATLCAASGFKFRYWAKFDERTVKTTCVNWGCHDLIAHAETFFNETLCPFDERMSLTKIRESIVKPFREHCKETDIPRATVKRGHRPNPASCYRGDELVPRTELIFLADKLTGKDVCELITGYRFESLEPLTESILQKMCFQPSCELILYQMANPPFEWMGCSSEMIARRNFIEAKILRPYYDGCYEPSSLAADYFDVAYRQRKSVPSIPPSPNYTIVPIVDDDSASGSEGSTSGVDEDGGNSGQTAVPGDNQDHRTSSPSPETPSHTGRTTKAADTFQVLAIAAVALAAVVLLMSYFVHRARRRQRERAVISSETRNPTAPEDRSKAADYGVVWGPNDAKPVWADSTLAELFVHPSTISDVRLIGSGGQGLVYLVKFSLPGHDRSDRLACSFPASSATVSRPPRQFLAAKRLGKHHAVTDPEAVATFIAEIKLVASLQHPQIVSLVGVTWTNGFDVQALFEYMPGGDLCAYLSATKTTDQGEGWTATKLQLAIDVIDALAYVHARTPVVVHRDIKSRNVLLTASPTTAASHQDATCSPIRAKLTDFGVARSQSAQGTMTTGVGTSRWLAPEVIVGGGTYDESCDVYSFGVVLSELDTHELPFMDQRTPSGEALPAIALLEVISRGEITPAFGPSCPAALLSLARACLSFDPKQRPTAIDVARVMRLLHAKCRQDGLLLD